MVPCIIRKMVKFAKVILSPLICVVLYILLRMIHYKYMRPCIVADVAFSKFGLKYAATDKSMLCSAEDYPDIFQLETHGRELLEGTACLKNTFLVKAVYFNGTELACQPWVFIQGRILGPSLEVYPGIGKYNLFFNSVKIRNIKNGLFQVTVPALKEGQYWVELTLSHAFRALGSMYNEETYTNPKCVGCIDTPVNFTPVKIILRDHGFCGASPTPLCKETNKLGRWTTVPQIGCDGSVCEGDINYIASSGRVWAPYDCHYKLFSSEELKKCTENKNILLLGDSVMQEIAHDIMQLSMYVNALPGIGEMVMKGAILDQRVKEWRQVWENGADIVMNSIMTHPLGCGVSCVTDLSNEQLHDILPAEGKIDLLLVNTGIHDIAPVERTTPKYYDVFAKYDQLLPDFIEKMSLFLKPNGRVIWILPPDPSDQSRCDYLSPPRLKTVREITKKHLQNHTEIVVLNYFDVSENCNCGNIHKGCRFFHSNEADQSYNGFVSRMLTHMILNHYCH